MVFIEMTSALVILMLSKILFSPFIRTDATYVMLCRIGGYLGITAILHYTLGDLWAWYWVTGLPLLGLSIHLFFVRLRGFRLFRPEKPDAKYRSRR